jgi:hypothetical protein
VITCLRTILQGMPGKKTGLGFLPWRAEVRNFRPKFLPPPTYRRHFHMANAQPAKIKPQRVPVPLPKNLSKEEFNGLVNHLCRLLAIEGFDPAESLSAEILGETVDGKPRTRFLLYISETTRHILEHPPAKGQSWHRIRSMFGSFFST